MTRLAFLAASFRRRVHLLALAALAGLGSCNGPVLTSDTPVPLTPAAVPATAALYVDVSPSAGLNAVNVCGDSNKDFILEVNGAGACWLDFDGDGVLDVYLVNGSTMDNLKANQPGEPNRLFRGRGDGTFGEVAEAAGAADQGWGYGCAVADFDNDGWPDLYVTNLGSNRLYRNATGHFEDVTELAGVAGSDRDWSTGAVFADFDGDGHLDLFVANYLDFNLESPPLDGKVVHGVELTCKWAGKPVMCGPLGLTPQPDRYFHGLGDGRFADETDARGFSKASPAFGFAAVPFDLEGDGDTDLYVANDSVANHLWRNDGTAGFVEIALRAGVAMDETGAPQGSMGLDIEDFDDDGRSDLVYTNFARQYNSLLRNLGDGLFVDASFPSGVGGASIERLGWGVMFVDFDNDRDLDLFVVNGHVYPGVGTEGDAGWRQRNQLLRNDAGKYQDVSDGAGDALQQRRVGRGLAVADFDLDGGVDLLVTNLDVEPTLLRNTGPRGHWLEVELVGTRSNRDGLGARVKLEIAGRTTLRVRHGGGGYLSASSHRLHFGLGALDRIQRLTVEWPSGDKTVIEEVAPDQLIRIREGGATAEPVRSSR